jgi:hypothetical protein
MGPEMKESTNGTAMAVSPAMVAALTTRLSNWRFILNIAPQRRPEQHPGEQAEREGKESHDSQEI